jgi:aminobenzoyl-glutamate transport protein
VSVINVITPLSAYFPIVYGVVKKYDKDAGMGTIIANMTPYSVWFLIFWLAQLIIWYLLKLPMGPGAPMMM